MLINRNDVTLLLIDIQEKLINKIHNYNDVVIVAKNHDASFRVKQLHGMKVTNSNIGDSISYMKTVKLNDAIRELNLEMITPEGNGVSIPACIENSIILKNILVFF